MHETSGSHHSSSPHNNGSGQHPKLDFARSPFLVIWEVTRACDLQCLHCRAEAQPKRDPRELTTEQGRALLDEIRRFGRPLFIFTGGDPLKRADLFDLISHAKGIGLSPAMSPSGTPLLDQARLTRAAQAGIRTVSISLDGAEAEAHDHFRGVPGSYDLSLRAATAVHEAGMRLQINTTVGRHNGDDLPRMAELVARLGAARWELFFLVPTGRADQLVPMEPQEYERVSHWLYDQTDRMETHITAVEANFYRRVVLSRMGEERNMEPMQVFEQERSGGGRFLPGINSGNGFVFISHTGEIYPSGFLPLSAGNVKRDSLVEVYRNHPVFQQLRQPSLLKGRCGRCQYRSLCGGSRARAYAVTGDYLASDPYCIHQPEEPTHDSMKEIT